MTLVQQFGPYHLLRKLAAGGMAEIFLARQWGDGGFFRDVVIKRLFPHLAEHPSALEMFQYEARLLAHLSHPNIPQVFDLGYLEDSWYMAMEYVDGYTVADVWRAGARSQQFMPLQVAVAVMSQLCEALHHAHERRDRAGRPLRIVHRDVTPHNAMLTPDGVAKLMDFGVAKTAARPNTEAGTVKGTFAYMAPEQVRARELDKRADVFSLGVILFELTTGTRLFRGTDVEVMTQVVEQDAAIPSERVPGYPKDLEEIVMAALCRDRAKRLPSAAHLTFALEDYAVRHGMYIGPRAISKYVQSVFPYQPETDNHLAMVAAAPSDAAVSPVDLDNDGIARDLNFLDPSAEPTSPELKVEPDTDSHPRVAPKPPEPEVTPLSGFDDEETDRPVVLLNEPKRKSGDGLYVRDLERRLEEDD